MELLYSDGCLHAPSAHLQTSSRPMSCYATNKSSRCPTGAYSPPLQRRVLGLLIQTSSKSLPAADADAIHRIIGKLSWGQFLAVSTYPFKTIQLQPSLLARKKPNLRCQACHSSSPIPRFPCTHAPTHFIPFLPMPTPTPTPARILEARSIHPLPLCTPATCQSSFFHNTSAPRRTSICNVSGMQCRRPCASTEALG